MVPDPIESRADKPAKIETSIKTMWRKFAKKATRKKDGVSDKVCLCNLYMVLSSIVMCSHGEFNVALGSCMRLGLLVWERIVC